MVCPRPRRRPRLRLPRLDFQSSLETFFNAILLAELKKGVKAVGLEVEAGSKKQEITLKLLDRYAPTRARKRSAQEMEAQAAQE